MMLLRISATYLGLNRQKLESVECGLRFGENRMIVNQSLLKLYYNVTDGQTDRRTYSTISITALSAVKMLPVYSVYCSKLFNILHLSDDHSLSVVTMQTLLTAGS